MSTTEIPRGESGPRYVRFQAELVLEVTAAGELTAAALSRIAADTFMPQRERIHAEASVGDDESEALACLVDPADLVDGVPGVELVQASWSCAHTEYDPTNEDWAAADDDLAADDGEDAENAEGTADAEGARRAGEFAENAEDDLR